MKASKFTPLLVAVAGLLAYCNSFDGAFVLDDVESITNNPTIQRLWPIWRVLSPPANTGVGGRPVVNLSLAINYALGRTAVQGYHALNLAIHILAGMLLFGIVRRTLLRPVLRKHFEATALHLALAIAVIWTVHPLQTEAVTYVSQRAESLMGLFYLLVMYCFIRGTESHRFGVWFTLCIVACLLGMATKEVMVTAPLMVLLYDRTFVAGSFREAWTQRRRLYVGLASTWLLLGYVMTGIYNRGVGHEFGVAWWAYALTECRAVVHYLRLAIWPHPLIFDYGTDIIVWHVADVATNALILLLLATGTVVGLVRRPALGYVGAWFFVILAPASSVVPVIGQPMAEHRMYLPLIAVVVMTVVGAFMLGKYLVNTRQELLRAFGWGSGGIVVLVLTVLTFQRNRDYLTRLAIWQDTVDKCPRNFRAHNHLGLALKDVGKVKDAIGQYERALQINPDDPWTHNNFGNLLLQEGRVEDAILHLEEALRINPRLAEARVNLGNALLHFGKVQEAVGEYEQALRLKSDYTEAHDNLGNALIRLGKVQEAVEQYEQVLRIKPDDAGAHNGLGVSLIQLGKAQEAISHYERALRIQPDNATVHNNFGVALTQLGKAQEAISHYKQAVRIRPSYAEAYFNLGNILLQEGKLQEAIVNYQAAVRIRPDYAAAQSMLAQLLVVQ